MLSIGMPRPSATSCAIGRLVALAVAVAAGEHGHRAGRMHAHLRALEQARARAERARDVRGRDAARLDIGRHAHAAQFAAHLRLGAPLLESGPVGRLQRHIQRRVVVAAVVLQRHRRLVGEGVVGNEIPAPDLDSIHVHLARRDIDEALEQVCRLRAAGAAIGIDRHGVGEHRAHLDIDRRRRVNAGEQGRVQIGRDAGREGRQIGADIGERRDAQRQELAVLVQRQLCGRDVVAPMRVGHERFGTVRRPLHRPLQLAGGPGNDRLLGVVVDLGAEAAADIGRKDAQLAFRDMQHERAHQQPDHVRVLAGRVEREVARGRVEIADRGARLHRVGDQPVVDQLDLRDLVRLIESGIGGALVAQLPVVAGVAGCDVPELRRRRLDRILDGRDRAQRLVVDFDQLGRVPRGLAAVGDHHGDLVADIAHASDRERRMRRLLHRAAVLELDRPAAGQAADIVLGHVRASEHGDDALGLRGLRRVDRAEICMRMRRAQDVGVQLAGAVDVVGVHAPAGQEAEILLAADGGADAVIAWCHGSPHSAAARPPRIAAAPAWIDLTML